MVLQVGALENLASTGGTVAGTLAEQGGCTKAPAPPAPPSGDAGGQSASAPGKVNDVSFTGGALAVDAAQLGGALGALPITGSSGSGFADAQLAVDAAFPEPPRRFATWVLSFMILAGAALATAATVIGGRLRQRSSASPR